LGHFFAPKTRCPPPSFANLLVVGRDQHRLPMLAQEIAERPLSHASVYRRIFCTSIVVPRVPQMTAPQQTEFLNHKLDDDNFGSLGRLINLPNIVI
jgi:hypothetical protein